MKLNKGGKCFVCELHPKKQLLGSKAQFEKNGIDIVLDVFHHSEIEYINSAEEAGFYLIAKKDWFDNLEDIPRLISFIFEKPK